MTATDIQALLDHCDRGSEVGVRDFAILTLIARLGLRSIEVARLELDDVDWREPSGPTVLEAPESGSLILSGC